MAHAKYESTEKLGPIQIMWSGPGWRLSVGCHPQPCPSAGTVMAYLLGFRLLALNMRIERRWLLRTGWRRRGTSRRWPRAISKRRLTLVCGWMDWLAMKNDTGTLPVEIKKYMAR